MADNKNKNKSNNTPEPTVDPSAGIAQPVIGDDTIVPVVEVEKTEVEPVLQPTAVVPNVVKEINEAVLPDGVTAASQILTTKGGNALRVEIIYDGYLGSKLLKKGDITDDDEYVALLKTERGQRFAREVK